MSKKKRTSFFETLELRKVFAHLDCEWTTFVGGRSLESEWGVPAVVLNLEHSPSFYIAKETFAKGKGQPRDRSRGLVGEGEEGGRVEANRISNTSPIGSPSQQGRVEHEPSLVIVVVQQTMRQPPSQANQISARFENAPANTAIAVVQATQPDASRLAEESLSGIVPIVQQGVQRDRENPMVSDRNPTLGFRPQSSLEVPGRSHGQKPIEADSHATLDQLMSDMGEDVYRWSFTQEAVDTWDKVEVKRERSSLLPQSTTGDMVNHHVAKSWGSMYTQGLPIPSGMVHLQVGELEDDSVAKNGVVPQIASLTPSSFGLIQWFAGAENETHGDAFADSFGETKSMDRGEWSLNDGVTDVVFMILAGGLATEGARRTRTYKSFACRLSHMTLRRVGASRVQSTSLARGGDDGFLGGS